MQALRPLVDDPQISDDDVVFRLVRPDTIDFGPPPLARSHAFQQRSPESAAEYGLGGACFSVALRSVWESEGGSVADLLAKFDESWGIVALPVGGVRNLCRVTGAAQPQGVMLDPTDEPWHAVVWDLSGTKRSKPAEKALTQLVIEWVHLPEPTFTN